MNSDSGSAARRLNALLAEFGEPEVGSAVAEKFEAYLRLLLRWNARINLTAVRDEDGILRRHFLESIACARAIPPEVRTLLDFGSGAGFPGIPIELCRPEIAVTLAESQNKKAAFLREAARVLEISIEVHSGRAETLQRKYDCVTLRAVDRMDVAVGAASGLVSPFGWLCVLTTQKEEAGVGSDAHPGFTWEPAVLLPGGSERILLLGRRDAEARGH